MFVSIMSLLFLKKHEKMLESRQKNAMDKSCDEQHPDIQQFQPLSKQELAQLSKLEQREYHRRKFAYDSYVKKNPQSGLTLNKQFSFKTQLRSLNTQKSNDLIYNSQIPDNQQRPQVMDNLTQNSFFHLIRGYNNDQQQPETRDVN